MAMSLSESSSEDSSEPGGGPAGRAISSSSSSDSAWRGQKSQLCRGMQLKQSAPSSLSSRSIATGWNAIISSGVGAT